MPDDATWPAIEAKLAAQLADLGDGEFLVLGEPTPPPGEPQGLLRRRPPPPPGRYVQFRADEEWVYGECVGAVLFGGDWPATPQRHEQIRALGWLAPGDEDPTDTEASHPNYWLTLRRARSAELATAGVAALQVLEVDPGTVAIDRGR